jgi:hypothetical protein
VVDRAVSIDIVLIAGRANVPLNHPPKRVPIPVNPNLVADEGFARIKPCGAARFVARD